MRPGECLQACGKACSFVYLALQRIAPSSNGKTADSGSVYRGSNPCGAARGPRPREIMCGSWIHNPHMICILALSSNGLGRSPLKAKIRVRFPLRLQDPGFHRPGSFAFWPRPPSWRQQAALAVPAGGRKENVTAPAQRVAPGPFQLSCAQEESNP